MMRRAALVASITLVAVVVWAVTREQDLGGRTPRGSAPSTPPSRRTTPPPARVEETEAPAARGVTGVVTDEDGSALAGANVRVHSVWEDGSIRRWNRRAARTGEDGAYAFDDLRPGRYAIQATHGDARSPRRIVALESAARVDLRVVPGPAELRIDLVPQHGAVDLRTFALKLYEWTDPRPADDGGGWTLRGLHPGDVLGFQVGFQPDQFAWSERPRVSPKPGGSREIYEVAVTETRQRYVVKVDRFVWIRGRLVKPDGTPGYGGVEVICGDRFRERERMAPEFAVRALPGEPLSLFVHSGSGLGTAAPILLAPLPGGAERELTIELEELPGVVTGRILDDEGRPPRDENVSVGVRLRIGRHFPGAGRAPDADGRVRIERLPCAEGSVTVDLESESPWARPLPIAVNVTRDAPCDFGTIRLSEGGVLDGVVRVSERSAWDFVIAYPLDAAGEPILAVGSRTKPGADGSFRIDRLAPARYEVTFWSGSRSTTRSRTRHVRATTTVEVFEGVVNRVELRE